MVYRDGLELIRLEEFNGIYWIECEIWPVCSRVHGFVSEGCLDSLEKEVNSANGGEANGCYGGPEDVRNMDILVPLREQLWRQIWRSDLGVDEKEGWDAHGLAGFGGLSLQTLP